MKDLPATSFNKKEYFRGKNSNYNKLPGGYTFLRRALFWKGKVKRISRFKPNGKVLELGCAYGFLLFFMKEKYEVYGCDISQHAIRVCKKIFSKSYQNNFFVHDASRPLPFPKSYFDVIICNDVIEHIPNVSIPLMNIRNVLADDGIFYLRIPIKTRSKITEFLRFDRDISHVSIMPENKLLAILEKLKFEIVEKRYLWMGAIPFPKLIHFGTDLNLILKKRI
ncbi:MAG: class I SAM-dependent methyltransferase [Promethearchaeota archaeon]